jgi:type II secretory pathway pseudopilin PulG
MEHSRRREGDDRGFTLIEVVITLAQTAFVFSALAALLAASLRTFSVQKTRAQGNDVATQAIEDLQRFDFNDLGVCVAGDPTPTPAPASVAGLTTVALSNCTNPNYADPCTALSSAVTTYPVPRQSYNCLRNGITYAVKRFVVWSDSSNTGKRLAVFVSWTDRAGIHQVAQESSLRAPNSASVVGTTPPQFVSTTVSPTSATIDGGGLLQAAVTLQASVSYVTGADSVYVTINTIQQQPDGSTGVLPSQYPLTSSDNGQTWQGQVPAGTRIGAGSQVVQFTAVRPSTDGKSTARIHPTAISFCTSSCPSNLPQISTISMSALSDSGSTSATAIDIDSSGALLDDVTITATTSNTPYDTNNPQSPNNSSLLALLPTQSGTTTVAMQPKSASCSNSNGNLNCTQWTGQILSGVFNGRFAAGSQKIYVVATIPFSSTNGVAGSSAVGTTANITFQ